MKTLFDIPVAHRDDPITSYKAGEDFHKSGKAKTHYKIILNYLRKHDGSTGHEIANGTELTHVQVMRRTSELCNQFKIREGSTRQGGREVTWWINE